LGMLSIGRSLALAISNNKFFYQFGHDQKLLIEIGGGRTFGIANPVIILVALTLIMGFVLRYTRWGRHLYAIGGNENAARLAGVPVDRLKMSVYVLSGFMTAISASRAAMILPSSSRRAWRSRCHASSVRCW